MTDHSDTRDRVAREGSTRPQKAPPTLRTRLLKPSLEALDSLTCEAVAVGISSDLRPLVGAAGFLDWRLCGELSRLLEKEHFAGREGEQVLLATQGRIAPVRVFLFGWGPSQGLPKCAPQRLEWMVEVLDAADVQSVAVALPEPCRPLLSYVDAALWSPLGERLDGVFDTDDLWVR